MELSERYIQQLESEGFTSVYEWQDPAGTMYPEHTHQGETVIWLTDGSATLEWNGQKKELQAGDRIDIPPQTAHTVAVGPQGWIVIIGEDKEKH